VHYQRLTVVNEGGLATVRLNRPEKKNAMDPQMHREMSAALAELRADDAVRVLILTGTGDSFCAGQDLKAYFSDTFDDPLEARKISDEAMHWAEVLRLFPKPTIAAVNGWCIGGGLRVMGLCDIAIASDRAKFALSEINFGNFPAGGSMKMAMELLSHRDVLYMALTGDSIDAFTAERLRLVYKTVPHDRLAEEVGGIASNLKKKNPVALMIAKEVFWRDKRMTYGEAVEWELAKQAELSYLQKGEWVREGINGFVNGNYKPAFESYTRVERRGEAGTADNGRHKRSNRTPTRGGKK
jgi:trans-feruloyl-CoA hydratase/vanillin synthase